MVTVSVCSREEGPRLRGRGTRARETRGKAQFKRRGVPRAPLRGGLGKRGRWARAPISARARPWATAGRCCRTCFVRGKRGPRRRRRNPACGCEVRSLLALPCCSLSLKPVRQATWVGVGRYCSPRRIMPSNPRNEGSSRADGYVCQFGSTSARPSKTKKGKPTRASSHIRSAHIRWGDRRRQ